MTNPPSQIRLSHQNTNTDYIENYVETPNYICKPNLSYQFNVRALYALVSQVGCIKERHNSIISFFSILSFMAY